MMRNILQKIDHTLKQIILQKVICTLKPKILQKVIALHEDLKFFM